MARSNEASFASMNVVTRIVLGLFLASSLGSVMALLAGASWWRWVSAPALVLSGLAAIGHLVTLDDDARDDLYHGFLQHQIWTWCYKGSRA